ncbi:male sterility protein-domain-containing protein [Xylariaceae sp. FL1651]|nr:male sterility protein-domain-containing protein [Xylariaceae sp. FL1651]
MPYLNGHTPKYGHRLVPNIIDEVALNEPETVFASIPLSEDLKDGYLDVTYRTVANAINRASWWLSENMGLANTSEVFSYIGPNDLRYPIFLVAAMKCGYQMMLPSPRNSKEYQLELLRRTDCKTVFCARSHTRYLDEIQGEDDLDLVCAVVPELSEILDDASEAIYPFSKTYYEIHKDKFMILHTSGSTGPPKPITFSIESTTTEDAHQSLDDPSQRLWWRLFANRRYFLGMPCFHSAGIWFALFIPVYYRSTVVYGPAKRPLTSDVASVGMVSGRISGGFYPPSILEDISKSPANLDSLRNLEFAVYGGGALSKSAGDKLSRITTLHNFIGFTEASAPPRFVMDPEDWNYFEFHPASGFIAKHHHDDLYKMTFERKLEYESIQSCFRIMPDLQEYSPGDLISRHPTRKNLWTHRGRMDDLVVLSNGEKFNPIPAEEAMRLCHYVKDVIISGEGKFQASVLIERDPKTALDVSNTEIIEALWPFVETANKSSSAQSRIIRSLIFVVPLEKPFSRSAKGTLQRKTTLKNFEAELNALYSGSKTNSWTLQAAKRAPSVRIDVKTVPRPVPTPQKPPSKASPTTTHVNERDASKSKVSVSSQTVRDLVTAICNIQPFSDTNDLFEQGMDSLQATEMADHLRRLSKSWPQDQEAAIKLLYTNPSIHGIITALKSSSTIADELDFTGQGSKADMHDPVLENDDLEGMVEKYTANMAELLPTRAKTVVLTGATGSLGCHLLESLMHEPLVTRIICLHRGEDDGMQRQKIASEKIGLHFNLGKKPVDFFRVDLSRSDLGLKPSQLSELLSDVDAIIHNAWNVDFNQSLRSFETHIAGVRHLADLAARSQRRARLIFVSSVASVMNWDSALGEVPEEIQSDSRVVGSNGYAKSKHVAELILQKAAASSDLAVSIVRVAQIAGPIGSPGTWNASDWLPMLVSTSKALGVLPKSLGAGDDIDWVPIDIVAGVFMDLLRQELKSRASSQCQVYHITNPQKTSWGALLPATCHMLGSDLRLVPMHEWIQKLQQQGDLHYDIRKFPALKILPFYKGLIASPEARMATLDTTKTLAISKTLANVEAVQGVWMERWIQSWTI